MCPTVCPGVKRALKCNRPIVTVSLSERGLEHNNGSQGGKEPGASLENLSGLSMPFRISWEGGALPCLAELPVDK